MVAGETPSDDVRVDRDSLLTRLENGIGGSPVQPQLRRLQQDISNGQWRRALRDVGAIHSKLLKIDTSLAQRLARWISL